MKRSLGSSALRRWRACCMGCIGLCLLCGTADARSNTHYSSYYAYEDNPVVEFTRSLARLNRISEMCSDIQTADYRTYALLIQQYVRMLYQGDAPYWVLAEVKERITDQTLCKWLVTESLISYQFAYDDYLEVARPALPPPLLTEHMSEPGHAPIDTVNLRVAPPSKH